MAQMEYSNNDPAPVGGDTYPDQAPPPGAAPSDAVAPAADDADPRDYPMDGRTGDRDGDRRTYERGGYDRERDRAPPPPRRPTHAPEKPNPSQTLGVFGLSVRTRERDLDYEFGRYGTVESVHIVYDQRSERSRGFGFIRMGSVDEAALCIEKLNGIDLNGRRIRVDFSVTARPHDPTPGAYMGQRRPEYDQPRPRYEDRGDRYGSRYDDRRHDDRRGGGYGGGDRSGRDHYDRGHERSPPRRRRDDYDDRRRSPSPVRDRDPRASVSRSAYDDPAVPTGAADARY